MHSECRNGVVYVSGEVTVSTVTAPLFRAYCQQLGYLKTSEASFAKTSEASFAKTSEVSFAKTSETSFAETGEADTAATASPTVDFSGVTRADSVCISLLAAAKRSRPQAAWSFIGIPAGVAALAQLYEVGDWITS